MIAEVEEKKVCTRTRSTKTKIVHECRAETSTEIVDQKSFDEVLAGRLTTCGRVITSHQQLRACDRSPRLDCKVPNLLQREASSSIHLMGARCFSFHTLGRCVRASSVKRTAHVREPMWLRMKRETVPNVSKCQTGAIMLNVSYLKHVFVRDLRLERLSVHSYPLTCMSSSLHMSILFSRCHSENVAEFANLA